eukprot:TRINITY_DN15879_c0_g1_i1.p1 TRINITY_DN15879_c0_g1~~TRINITY_DN15879_c0_g1_i1.p1  ORF type:complete len:157 (-),score=18.52 TRINITY_DN15879_c0_g1_i1:211-681(-)
MYGFKKMKSENKKDKFSHPHFLKNKSDSLKLITKQGIKASAEELAPVEILQEPMSIDQNINVVLNRQITEMRKRNEELRKCKSQLELQLRQVYNFLGGMYLDLASSKKIIAGLTSKLGELECPTLANPKPSFKISNQIKNTQTMDSAADLFRRGIR